MNGQTIFVTGGTGFLGSRLIQVLLERGHRVRALARASSERDLGAAVADRGNRERLQWVTGDILDRESLRNGLEGCSQVYHMAAYARNWARDPSTFIKVNVEGTRNVLEAAAQARVGRIVYTSTIVVLGPTPPGVVGDEGRPGSAAAAANGRGYNGDRGYRFLTEYEESKAVAEAEALQRAAQGLPVVLVLPTRAYGPGKFTEGNAVSRMIDLYRRGRLPVLLNRGSNVGNYALVDDLVQGHLQAMDKGRIGERYILGGENIPLKRLFELVDELTGHRPRSAGAPGFTRHLWRVLRGGERLQVNLPPTLGVAYAWLEKWKAQWLGRPPQITPGWVATFLRDWAYSSAKAERELGYRITPLREGLRKTLDWLDVRPKAEGQRRKT